MRAMGIRWRKKWMALAPEGGPVDEELAAMILLE
jgi:hypothetical protein